MVDQATQTTEQQYTDYGNIVCRSNCPFKIGELVQNEDWQVGDEDFPGNPNPSYVKARTWRVIARSSEQEWLKRNPTKPLDAKYNRYFLIAAD